jgi:D-alanyl-D-alanine dipeptidase/CubicO group peptidase (beta-lactamase class C family)
MRLHLPSCLLLAACAAAPPPVPAVHAAAVAAVQQFAERQRADKAVPGIWVALLDGRVPAGKWSVAFACGRQAPDSAAPARIDAVHRAASISKLFTATAAMVLVQRGQLDLDAPVTRWVPDFAPQNPFGGEVTLRHLLSHRAGLVREPPVGHYFDPGEPSLEATVRSLNGTALVHAPGSAFKYSNPGLGVVGEAIARVTAKPFEDAVRELVLAPLGLVDADFEPRRDQLDRQPRGLMWTYDGRKILTPEFAFGYGPAANLRCTVHELVRFAASWFPAAGRRVLAPDTQAAMWALPEDQQRGCGLGFFVKQFDGHRFVGHEGAVYGFASTVAALPDEELAVAVVCTVDFGNGLAEAIADFALRALLASRAGAPIGLPEARRPVGTAAARKLAGRYQVEDSWFDLKERQGELWFDPCIGVASRMRGLGDHFVSDDRMSVGERTLQVTGPGRIRDDAREFALVVDPPPECPPELLPYLGEYGWDHNVLVVYEDGGRLSLLIEWLVREQPDREGPDQFRFGPGMYNGDLLRFERDAEGKVTAATVGGTRFPRRPDPDPRGFKITPLQPIAELRKAAAAAAPPPPPAGLRAPDLVDLVGLAPTLRFDIRYATADNFLGVPVYERAAPRLQRPAAQALLAAHEALAAHGLGLCIFDAYRPWSVTKVFHDATPPELRHFVADPAQGSRHNRGCAVDLTLYELATGEQVEMPSGYDEFTARAYPDWPGGTGRQRWHRELLRRAMEDAGFTVYEHEWWHFDFADWREYPVLNADL